MWGGGFMSLPFIAAALSTAAAQSCSLDQDLFVVSDAGVSIVRDTVNCSGGAFTVAWDGWHVLDDPITVGEGTTVQVNGVGGAETSIVGGGFAVQLFILQQGASLVLSNLTLQGGYRSADGAVFSGGGAVFAQPGSQVAIVDSILQDNSASSPNAGANYSHGGAVLAWPGSLVTITNSILQNNHASRGGGAVYVNGSALEIHGCKFLGNSVGGNFNNFSVDDPVFGDGGAIDGTDSIITINNTEFRGNAAVDKGGAVYASGRYSTDDSLLTIARCNFSENFAGNTSLCIEDDEGDCEGIGGGGALSASTSRVTILDSSFTDNFAHYKGGAMVLTGGSELSTGGLLLASNVAGDQGGAMHLTDMDVTVGEGEIMFEKNNASANKGGAISLSGSATLTVLDGASFINNSALDNGGAIYGDENAIAVHGGLFVDNTARKGGCVYSKGLVNITGGNFSSNGGGEVEDAEEEEWITEAGGCLWVANATIHGGDFYYNVAQSGGVIFVDSYDIEDDDRYPSPPVVTIWAGDFRNNLGVETGGVVRGQEGAWVMIHGGSFVGNEAEKGGVVHAAGINATGGVFHGNKAEDGGAFFGYPVDDTAIPPDTDPWDGMFVSGGEFTANEADRGGALFIEEHLLAYVSGGNFTANIAMGSGGAIRLNGYEGERGNRNNLTLSNAHFAHNSARKGGGAIFAEEGANVFCKDASFFHNSAGEYGGVMRTDQVPEVRWTNCSCLDNESLFGGAFFFTSTQATIEDSLLQGNVVPSGAIFFLVDSQVNLLGDSFVDSEEGQPQAWVMQLDPESSANAFDCTFKGWVGEQVILTYGNLALDACEFDTSTTSTLVSWAGTGPAPVVRNAVVRASAYAQLGEQLADSGIQGCNGTGADGGPVCSDLCLEADVGVLCGCYVPAATSTEDEVCLDGAGEIQVERLLDPPPLDTDVGTETPVFTYTVRVSVLGGNLTGTLWNSTVAWGGSEADLGVTYKAVPSAGVLGPDESIDVEVFGNLTAGKDGIITTEFKVSGGWMPSSQASDTLVTEIFLCPLFTFFCPSNNADCSCPEEETSCPFIADTQCQSCLNEAIWGAKGVAGLDCSNDTQSATLAQLPLQAGFWRESTESLQVRKCPLESACGGGNNVMAVEEYCNEGYTGVYCAVCAEDYGQGAGYECHKCRDDLTAGMAVLFAAITLLVLLPLLILICIFLVGGGTAVSKVTRAARNSLARPERGSVSSQAPSVSEAKGEEEKEEEEEEQQKGCGAKIMAHFRTMLHKLPASKLKIVVVVWQILTQFPAITSVNFPSAYKSFLGVIDVINFDLGWLFSASCLFPGMNFYDTLLLMTLVPLGCMLLLVGTYSVALCLNNDRTVASGERMQMVFARHVAAVLVLTFLIFSATSTVIFQTFGCEELEEASYLRADYSLECYDGKHTAYRIYAGAMIALYPVGIPLLYAFLLSRYKDKISPHVGDDSADDASAAPPRSIFRSSTRTRRRAKTTRIRERQLALKKRNMDMDIASTKFLWKDYRPDSYWFEVVECGRRVLLTGVLVFTEPDSATQVSIAVIFAFLSLIGFELLRPHLSRTDKWLYRMGCIVIFFNNMLALMIKADIGQETQASQEAFGVLLIIVNVMLFIAIWFSGWFAAQEMTKAHEDTAVLMNAFRTPTSSVDARAQDRPSPSRSNSLGKFPYGWMTTTTPSGRLRVVREPSMDGSGSGISEAPHPKMRMMGGRTLSWKGSVQATASAGSYKSTGSAPPAFAHGQAPTMDEEKGEAQAAGQEEDNEYVLAGVAPAAQSLARSGASKRFKEPSRRGGGLEPASSFGLSSVGSSWKAIFARGQQPVDHDSRSSSDEDKEDEGQKQEEGGGRPRDFSDVVSSSDDGEADSRTGSAVGPKPPPPPYSGTTAGQREGGGSGGGVENQGEEEDAEKKQAPWG